MKAGVDAVREPGPSWLSGWLMTPLVVWRLGRVLIFLLVSVLKSQTVWRRLDRRERGAVNRRWSRKLLRILGIRLVLEGTPRPGAKLIVANHISWLDIVAINAVVPSRFVSKAEVAHWPLIGRLVTMAGTLYLVRERRRDAMRVLGLMSHALRDGDTVAVFPEGTTGRGDHIMHFHANLLQAAIDANAPVQPLALRYSDRRHHFSDIPVYIGDTTLVASLWRITRARGLSVHARVLAPQAVTHTDRRALAARLHEALSQAIQEP